MSITSISSNISIPDGKISASVCLYEIREIKGEKFTIFKVLVKLGDQEWTVERRYNDFDRLHNEIKKMNPYTKLRLPAKRILGDNFSLDFIKKRMNGLSQYIQNAVLCQDIIKLPFVWEFLEISESNINALVGKNASDEGSQPHQQSSTISMKEDNDLVITTNDDYLLGTTHNPVATPSDFEFLSVIGKGSFGKVYQAKHRFENKLYAIKVLKKETIIKRNEVKHIMAERNVLIRNLQHPFLVGLHYSFQTRDKLYFVLDYVNGGELFFHLIRHRLFPEARVKFYAAEIAHAIGYMHSKDIIYRDLKPENILIDSEGHIRLTDFGLCKEGVQAFTLTATFCGTPEYLAPEILLKKPYTRAVDWWCLGSVVYEMLYGLPPFYSRDVNEMYNQILYKPLRLNPNINVSINAKNLIIGLLQKEQSLRLGSSESDFNELSAHPFFSDLSWQDLLDKKLPVPWIPELSSETDTKHIDPEFTREHLPESLYAQSFMNGSSMVAISHRDTAFSGFTYVPESGLK